MITVLEQGQVGSDTKHPSRSLTHLFWLNLGTFSSRKCFGLNYVTLFNILNYILQIFTKRKGEKEEKAELKILSKTNILRASFNNLHPEEYGTVKQNQDHLCPKALPLERVTVSI